MTCSEQDILNLRYGSAIEDRQAADARLDAAIAERDAARDALRPCRRFKPRLFIEGDQWCALLGENVQDGVAGFGTSPDEAMAAFDTEWATKVVRVTR